MKDSAAIGPSVGLPDQMLLALASVVYVSGLLFVFAQPAPRPAAQAGAPAAPAAPALGPSSADLLDPTPLGRHAIRFELQPGKGVEFKYRFAQGAGMVYVWTASANVKFEFHGEPDGAKPGYADTYGVGEGRAGRGTFVAPTRGIHGWYWENPGLSPVDLSLETSGFYTAGIEFTAAGPVERPIKE